MTDREPGLNGHADETSSDVEFELLTAAGVKKSYRINLDNALVLQLANTPDAAAVLDLLHARIATQTDNAAPGTSAGRISTNGAHPHSPTSNGGHVRQVEPTSLQVAAAKLWVELDEMDGLATGPLIRRVAQGLPIPA